MVCPTLGSRSSGCWRRAKRVSARVRSLVLAGPKPNPVPQARALCEDAGCKFSGGAPYYVLNERRITITIDHIVERQTAPPLALTASNLRLTFSRENSAVLRLLNQLDPFQ